MNIDFEKLLSIFLENGMHPTRAKELVRQIKNDVIAWPAMYEDKDLCAWALERGFLPGRICLYGKDFNENTYKNYWSDFDYFMAHPLNNHFAIWINDKLTLKYMLNVDGLSKYMPEYYLYIENDGHYTYLMDAPKDIEKNRDFLYKLLLRKKCLALKPNRGSGGGGFISLRIEEGKIIKNRDVISIHEFEELKKELSGYIVTEFIQQSSEMERVYPDIAAALRIVLYKKVQSTLEEEPDYGYLLGYARFATDKNQSASNNDQGGLAVTIDWENGVYRGGFRGLTEFWGEKENEGLGFKSHPNTGVVLDGKKIPNWDIIKRGLLDICKYLSSLDFFGMDVIITEDGFKLCEINSAPSVGRGQDLYGKCCLDNDDARKFAASKNRTFNKSFIECIQEAME